MAQRGTRIGAGWLWPLGTLLQLQVRQQHTILLQSVESVCHLLQVTLLTPVKLQFASVHLTGSDMRMVAQNIVEYEFGHH